MEARAVGSRPPAPPPRTAAAVPARTLQLTLFATLFVGFYNFGKTNVWSSIFRFVKGCEIELN